MRPLRTVHDPATRARLKPIKLVDLRKVGLVASAPVENDKVKLLLKVEKDGRLYPAT